MKKTMYIPKGQECSFDNLTCGRIVVNGSLHVGGRIKTKSICGKGFVHAKWITANSIVADTVDADTIATGTLAAAHVNAFDIHAAQSITVTSLLTANYVRAGRATYALAEIRELESDDVVVLAPKRRGLLRALLASSIRSKWAAAAYGGQGANATAEVKPGGESPCSATDGETLPDITRQGLEEAARLLSDPEFLRLRALFKVTRETGDVWQLVPNQGQGGRAAAAPGPFPAA